MGPAAALPGSSCSAQSWVLCARSANGGGVLSRADRRQHACGVVAESSFNQTINHTTRASSRVPPRGLGPVAHGCAKPFVPVCANGRVTWGGTCHMQNCQLRQSCARFALLVRPVHLRTLAHVRVHRSLCYQ